MVKIASSTLIADFFAVGKDWQGMAIPLSPVFSVY
jgi:hypothetical protein